MACDNVAPVQLVSGQNTPCGSLCKFTYNYGNAGCVLTNKEYYLDIQCYDGKNEVELTGYKDMKVSSVRLYNKSINHYHGEQTDAELIIQHSASGRNVFVCIPVTTTRGKNESTRWFNSIMSQIPTNVNAGQNVSNASEFSLNKVIPKGPYYFIDGAPFHKDLKYGCNSKDKIIIFDPGYPAKMHYSDIIYLKNRITTMTGIPPKAVGKSKLQYNKNGTKNGPGKEVNPQVGEGMTCVPVTDLTGKMIGKGGSKKVLDWVMDRGGGGEEFNFQKHVLPYLIPIISIVFALLLIYFFKWLHGSFKGGNMRVSLMPRRASSTASSKASS